MRESCIFCTVKHLMKARAQLQEFISDAEEYKKHFFYAYGELAEAEEESLKKWPELSEQIREQRKSLEENYPGGYVDFDELLESAIPIWDRVIKETDDYTQEGADEGKQRPETEE